MLTHSPLSGEENPCPAPEFSSISRNICNDGGGARRPGRGGGTGHYPELAGPGGGGGAPVSV